MIRRDIPPISAHAQRMSMLATLSHEGAVNMIERKAFEQDVDWIEAAKDTGAFDPSGDVLKGLNPSKNIMVTAIAIDTPDVLEALIKARPEALNMTLTPSEVVDSVIDSKINSEDLELTPYGFAMQYGKIDAMIIIETALSAEGPRVGAVSVLGGQQFFNAAQMHDYLTPMCYPSVYAHAIKLCFERDPDLDNSEIVDVAVTMIGRDSSLKSYQMWPAYVALDLYRNDAVAALEKAVTHGHLEIVKNLEGKVPWDEIYSSSNTSILIRVLEAQNKIDTHLNHYDAVNAMVKMAKLDGALDSVLRIVAQPDVKGMNGGDCAVGPVCVAPIAHLIEFGHQDVLHEMLKHSGLKPNDPPVPGAWPLQKMADARNDVIADFFRSYTARNRAQDLIDEISSPKHTASAP